MSHPIPEDLKEEYATALSCCEHKDCIPCFQTTELIRRIARLEAELREMTADRNLYRDDHDGEGHPLSEVVALRNELREAKQENAILRATVDRLKAPVNVEDKELRILKVKDALLWLEESAINMRRRLDGKGDYSIGRQSDATALHIKALLEQALIAARAGKETQ